MDSKLGERRAAGISRDRPVHREPRNGYDNAHVAVGGAVDGGGLFELAVYGGGGSGLLRSKHGYMTSFALDAHAAMCWNGPGVSCSHRSSGGNVPHVLVLHAAAAAAAAALRCCFVVLVYAVSFCCCHLCCRAVLPFFRRRSNVSPQANIQFYCTQPRHWRR